MKKLFNALAKQISSTQEFNFEEGNRTAVVEEKRYLFSRSVSCEFSDKGKGFLAGYGKVGGVSKQEVEAAKQAAQNYCQTGRVEKPKW